MSKTDVKDEVRKNPVEPSTEFMQAQRQHVLNECFGLASRLTSLTGLPAHPDLKDLPRLRVVAGKANEPVVALPLSDLVPSFALFAKNPRIDRKQLKGWWLLGYAEADASQMEIFTAEGPKEQIFSVSIPGPDFPKQVPAEDAELLDRSVANGMPSPFTVFGCLHRD